MAKEEKKGAKDKGADKPKKPAGDAAPKKEKGEKRSKASAAEAAHRPTETTPEDPNYVPRTKKRYADAVIPAMRKKFSYKNPMQVPRLQKVVVNMGLGQAVQNPKVIDSAVADMRAITGQSPIVTRARKSIASFKLRENLPIGVMVTLRRERMWEFLDRLISYALPRVRDFKGVSAKGFDGRGNFTMGLREQIIFPEIDYDKIDVVKGMNISFVTTAKTDEEGRALLAELGLPFRQ
jgi:large subunit ribosomal protein L5